MTNDNYYVDNYYVDQVRKLQQLFSHAVLMTVNPQLSLTESEISKIGTIKVEGIINPTNAEMDLKDGVGEDDIHVYFISY